MARTYVPRENIAAQGIRHDFLAVQVLNMGNLPEEGLLQELLRLLRHPLRLHQLRDRLPPRFLHVQVRIVPQLVPRREQSETTRHRDHPHRHHHRKEIPLRKPTFLKINFSKITKNIFFLLMSYFDLMPPGEG